MSNVFDLAARLTLDSSDYESGLKKAEGSAGKFKNAMGTAMKVGGAALAAGTAAVVAFGTKSVQAGMSFDKSMSQVAATMGKTMDEMQKEVGATETSFGHFEGTLGEFAQFMGKNTAFSASQAADALNYMALAGYNTQQSMEMLPNVLNLASAGNMDLAMASDMVTDAQTALGLSFAETNTMVDQMAKTSSKTNTSVSQLGEAILTIGATARGIKGGTTELNTVLGVLADNGIKGAEGGTHLRNMILSLQTPTKDGTKALKKLGMSYKDMYDSAGNLRSLPEIFQQMSKAMEGMDQKSRDAIISGVFNKTDLASANALLGTNVERWEELTVAIEDSNGAASKMAETQLDNLAGDITKFKSALEGAQLIVSQKLTPSLRKFVQFGTDAIGRLTNAFNEGGLNAVMEELGKILSEGIQMIIKAVPKIIEAAKSLLGAFIKGIVDNAPMIIDAAVEVVGMLASSIVDNLEYLLQSAIDIILYLGQALAENADQIAPTVIDVILTIVDVILNNLDKIIDVALQIIIALTEGLFEALPKLIQRLPELIMRIVQGFQSGMNKINEVGFDIIKSLIEGLFNALPELMNQIDELVFNIVLSFDTIRGKVANIFDNVKDAIKKAIEKIKDLFNFEWKLPKIKLPHFSWSWKDVGGILKLPSISVKWYKKAYDNPLLFTEPTIVNGRGFGDGGGSGEIVYGRDQLMRDIAEATQGSITVNVYASDGMDIDKLTEQIEHRLTQWQKQRDRAYA